jgi:hypothetical protein
MTALERRCRLLLRAYPDAYRQDRGEEIVGTLLEATPAGRSWPLARDIRGLAVGGLRARAALNRRLTTAENLRVAVVAGAAIYLSCTAASYLIFAVFTFTHRHGALRVAEWPLLLSGALIGLAVTLAWARSRRSVLVAAVIVAAVAVSLTTHWRFVPGWPVAELGCLAALALLEGRSARLGRGWLWPVALVVGWLAAEYLVPAAGLGSNLALTGAEALGILSLLWAVIDARPAVAMAVFLLANWLAMGIASLVPPFDIPAALPLLIVIALGTVVVWRLRRQSASVTTRSRS